MIKNILLFLGVRKNRCVTVFDTFKVSEYPKIIPNIF